MHPLKPGGGGQARLFGNDLLKCRFQTVDMGNLAFQRLARYCIGLQTDHARQPHGRLAAALFRLLLDKKMAIVFHRQLQCGLADVLLHVDGVQRVVLGPFDYLWQGKNARGQQSAGLQTFCQGQQLVFYFPKRAVQPFDKIVGRHKPLISYNILII